MTPERREELGRIALEAALQQPPWDLNDWIKEDKWAAVATAVANEIVPDGLEIITLRVPGTPLVIEECRNGWILVRKGSGSHPAACVKSYWSGKFWSGSSSGAVVFPSPAAALAEYREHVEGKEDVY